MASLSAEMEMKALAMAEGRIKPSYTELQHDYEDEAMEACFQSSRDALNEITPDITIHHV